MGEQMRGETIRAVAEQVCRFWDVPASMPLGRFGAELIPGLASGTFVLNPPSASQGTWTANSPTPPTGSFLMTVPPDPSMPANAGAVVFGEVYWADIPRGPVAHGYTLEEAKKWACAVVERLRTHDLQAGSFYQPRFHCQFARTVISQLAEGIGVLGRLCFLGEKAGLISFHLDELLINYLGDVQVFTEFQNYRRQILDTFHALMQGIHQRYPNGEIYVIAHSEGSVIAFLAMLEAIRGRKSGVGHAAGQPLDAPWANSFRGLMTIGSPIGKHQLLWPWLWDHLDGLPALPPLPGGEPAPARPTIRWCNYYDYGDPVGFNLQNARNWLLSNGWHSIFDFGAGNVGDIGFTRYPFPGKAHTDYWNDERVFAHFLGTVVWPQTVAGAPQHPSTHWGSWLVSRCFPYLLVLAILLLGTYFLVTGSAETHGIEQAPGDFARDLLAASLLLAGVTAAVRIPRLTWDVLWVVGVLLLFGACLYAFPFLASEGQQDRLWMSLSSLRIDEMNTKVYVHATSAAVVYLAVLSALVVACIFGLIWPRSWTRFIVFVVVAVVLIFPGWILMPQSWTNAWHQYDLAMTPATAAMLSSTVVVAFLAFFLSLFFPSWGVKTVVIVGTASLLLQTGLSWAPGGSFDKYHTIKQEAAEQMGLRGPLLDKAARAILRQLALVNNLHDKNPDLRRAARDEASKLINDPRFQEQARPPVDFLAGVVVLRAEESGALEVSRVRVWPFVLACAAFFYLWWLAAIVLDLTVVWHHFIKGEAIVKRLS